MIKVNLRQVLLFMPEYITSTGIVNNIRILHNRIDGGYYNIYFYGGDGTSDYGTNIIINGNMLSNAYYYGGYFYYTDFISFSIIL